MVLSYAMNIGIRKVVSYGSLEELDIAWQPQIKDSVKSYLNPFHPSAIFVLEAKCSLLPHIVEHLEIHRNAKPNNNQLIT